jgi:hypothetical protein
MGGELTIAIEHARHALDGAAIHTAHVEGVFRNGRQQADRVLPELVIGGWDVLEVHDIGPVLFLGFAHPPPRGVRDSTRDAWRRS